MTEPHDSGGERKSRRRRFNPRKLLVATAGIAAVNYALLAGCGGEDEYPLVANLVAPPGWDGSGDSGNVASPPIMPGAGGRGMVPDSGAVLRPDAGVDAADAAVGEPRPDAGVAAADAAASGEDPIGSDAG